MITKPTGVGLSMREKTREPRVCGQEAIWWNTIRNDLVLSSLILSPDQFHRDRTAVLKVCEIIAFSNFFDTFSLRLYGDFVEETNSELHSEPV